jgi:hypothetical protein
MTLTGVAGEAEVADQFGGEPLSPSEPAASRQADEARMASIFLGVCFFQALALSLAILHSGWRGWKLVGAIFAVMVVVTAVLSHIDSLYFLRDMSRSLIARLVVASTIVAAVFSPVAVWVLRRFRRDGDATSTSGDRLRSYRRWAAILLVLAALHIVVYFAFGYYVAWQSPELRAFYGGEDPGSFWLQMVSVVRDTPWLMPVQFLRGLLWGLMAVVLAASLRGPRWSAALITAGVFVSLFALPLAIPNPLMPDAVRHAHLVETVLSRGLYGLLAVWLVDWRMELTGAELGAAEA